MFKVSKTILALTLLMLTVLLQIFTTFKLFPYFFFLNCTSFRYNLFIRYF